MGSHNVYLPFIYSSSLSKSRPLTFRQNNGVAVGVEAFVLLVRPLSAGVGIVVGDDGRVGLDVLISTRRSTMSVMASVVVVAPELVAAAVEGVVFGQRIEGGRLRGRRAVAVAGVAAAVMEKARRGTRVRLLRRRGVICRALRSAVVVGVFFVDDGRQGELRENELLLAGAVGRVLLLLLAVAQAVDLSLVDHLARVVGFLLPDEAAGVV